MTYPILSDLSSSTKCVSFAGVLASANAILTSFATSSSPVVKSIFTGALAGGPFNTTRTVSVTTTTHASTYNIVDPIVVTGTDLAGNIITENLALTLVNGNETIVGLKGFLTVTSIAIPAQVDALGTFTFGVKDVILTTGCRRFRCGTTGNIKVTCLQDSALDTIPSVQAGELIELAITKLWGSTTTAQNITIFF